MIYKVCILSRYIFYFLGALFWSISSNYCAQRSLCSSISSGFCGSPRCIGLLESVFRAIVNRSRVYPPLAGLSAVFLVRRLSCPPSFLSAVFVAEWRSGGVAEWRSGGVEGLPTVILEGLPAVFVEGWPADHLLPHRSQEGEFKV